MRFFGFLLTITLVILGAVYFLSDDIEDENRERGFYIKAGDIINDSIYKST